MSITSIGDGLNNLRHVDATGATGNVEVEGFDAEHDLIMVGGDAGHYGFLGGIGDDILTGGAREDSLNGRTGDDKLTGGGGGDALRGQNGKDTYIYNLASDSQVRFDSNGDPSSGFDSIGPDWHSQFQRLISPLDNVSGNTLISKDVIDLRNVVSLRGEVQKKLSAAVGDKGLWQYLRDSDNGDGLFETAVDNSFDNNKHSIVVVETKEADKSINSKWNGALLHVDADNPNAGGKDLVTWILVDVDGDGDFDASVDMAIALPGGHWAGSVTADHFI